MKLTVSKSKNSASFYVQKTIRLEDGTVTSKTVEKLGNLDEVRAKAGGKNPYEWAREYVNELNRKEYEQQKEAIVSFSPTRIVKKDEAHSYNCGYLFLQDIYYSLGLDKICKDISARHPIEYDLNQILSGLVYTRILYPSSKRSSFRKAKNFIEQPSYGLHDIYRALSVLAEESDFIQSELYKNSQAVLPRSKDILYYDCTNYYVELEEADELRRYGKSKQHQPLPIVGLGLFMDQDGIPMAFDIYPGSNNEQPTLKPLEKKVINDYGLNCIIICTDAGLSSKANRRFNDKSILGERIRSFITTQSVKQLPDDLKEFVFDPEGWHLTGDNRSYGLRNLDDEEDYNKIFYKDRRILEDTSGRKNGKGENTLEQHLIVSFSIKFQMYQQQIRAGQIDRAQKIIKNGHGRKRPTNQNDPNHFIGHQVMTQDGEVCEVDILFLNTYVIENGAQYDGYYSVCTNLDDMDVMRSSA